MEVDGAWAAYSDSVDFAALEFILGDQTFDSRPNAGDAAVAPFPPSRLSTTTPKLLPVSVVSDR
ncbi:MAG: hypothetical protein AAFU85_30770, partial [Planctomycetota bacterium]